ncbi:CvpA family protein [Pontibacillus marinus]|uniref:Membrane protein n=1 Tax=Pontibacillus marinus BH030004 = DSM 16465 TaxID=1385511 RepID=A0A0A5FVI9_9BACI|nr:CvpA family protein [Pontibacillus marinus]KGX84821.1 membrane protein [Pontibacillus marinus BH030004 = DSM 16465]
MIDLLLIAILILGFFIGMRRGFVLQLFHMTGFIIAFIFAVIYYDDLAPKLELWLPYPDLPEDQAWAVFLNSLPLEGAFYHAVAFAALFFGVKIILQIVASMLDFLADLPLIKSFNGLLGAGLGLIEMYFIVFIFLYLAALVPIEFVQDLIDNSFVAQTMIEHTPLFSEQIKTMWFEHVSEHFNQ